MPEQVGQVGCVCHEDVKASYGAQPLGDDAMEEKVSVLSIFSEKLRGLAGKEGIPNDDVEKLEAFFKRMLEQKELRPEAELEKLVGV